MKTARGSIAVITALVLGISSLPAAVAAPANVGKTSAATQPVPDSSQSEYDAMVQKLKKSVTAANAEITKLRPTVKKLVDQYGYDAAFEANNRLDDAQLTADQISSLIDQAGPTSTPEASKLLRRARSLTIPLDQKLADARYDIELVNKIKDRDEEKQFECPDAVDEGDTPGSSIGSSTTGLFNSTGNRIVYDDAGRPKCSTNIEFFGGKLLKFMSFLTTIMTLLVTLYKLSSLVPKPH